MSPWNVGQRIGVAAAVAVLSLGCGKSSPTGSAPAPPPGSARPAPGSPKPTPDTRTTPKADAAPLLTIGTDPRDLRDGRQVRVTGRLVLISGGINEVLEAPAGSERLTTATPILVLEIGRGEQVACAFSAVDRVAFDRWQAKNPPGTQRTSNGLYSWSAEGYHHYLLHSEAAGDFPKPLTK